MPTRPIDPERLRTLTERELAKLNASTPQSAALFERAKAHLVGGVASSYHLREPWPIYVDRGQGSQIWDVDGNGYVDILNGYGCMVQGHGHPVVARAVDERFRNGSVFAATTEESIEVAEELARRFGLPKWRFTNSGTEATMDAIRIARAATGRETVMKIFGSYHGHHDYVMVSLPFPYDDIGPRDDYASIPFGAGIPERVPEMTVAVPFNDADAMERRIEKLAADDRLPACVIMEPVMTNIGIILPEPGYLEAVRELTRKHGVLLIFDEVKTGLSIAPGGATERYGVTPDLVTLAKVLGAGLPSGAIGGTDAALAPVESGDVYQVGTFAGNPLTMAAAKASLFEVLTPEAYEHLERIGLRALQGCASVIERTGLPARAVGVGCKGHVSFSADPVTDYESFRAGANPALATLAYLYNMNHGVFVPPEREEEWTFSVVHTEADVDRFVEAFDAFATDLMD